MDIKIIVAAHKEYRMPEDAMYLPVYVGSALHGDHTLQTANQRTYIRDDGGDNISLKNPHFCELTGLYWMWKNLDAEFLGLVHYRRHLKGRGGSDKWQRVLTKEKAAQFLSEVPVLLPKKRNYFVETNYSQYAHAHHAIDLDTTRAIIEAKYPEYLPAFDASMQRTTGHRFNMMVMRKDLMDAYCSWLFDILFELERQLDISGYSPYDSRVFGFVSERLLDVWLETNHIAYKELPVVNMESQHWFKKGTAFLKRKLSGGKKEA